MTKLIVKSKSESTIGTPLFQKINVDEFVNEWNNKSSTKRNKDFEHFINSLIKEKVDDLRLQGYIVRVKEKVERKLFVSTLEWISFSYKTYIISDGIKTKYKNFLYDVLDIKPRQRVTNTAIEKLMFLVSKTISSREASNYIDNRLSHSSINYYFRNAKIKLLQEEKIMNDCDLVVAHVDSTFQRKNSRTFFQNYKIYKFVKKRISELKNDLNKLNEFKKTDVYKKYLKIKAKIETKFVSIDFFNSHKDLLHTINYIDHNTKYSKFKMDFKKIILKLAPNAKEYAIAGDYANGIKSLSKLFKRKGKFYGCKWHYLRDFSRVFGLRKIFNSDVNKKLEFLSGKFIKEKINDFNNGKDFLDEMMQKVAVYQTIDNITGEINLETDPSSDKQIMDVFRLEIQENKKSIFNFLENNFIYFKNSVLNTFIKHSVEQKQKVFLTKSLKWKGSGYSLKFIENIFKLNVISKLGVKHMFFRNEKELINYQTKENNLFRIEKDNNLNDLYGILKEYSITKESSLPVIQRGIVDKNYMTIKRLLK